MYKKIWLIALVCSFSVSAKQTIKVAAKHNAKMQLLLGVVGADARLNEVVDILKNDLAFTQQFDVKSKAFDAVPSKKEIKKLYKDGYPLTVFVSTVDDQHIGWRMYDTKKAKMVQGKQCAMRGDVLRGWAHNVSDSIWPALTSQPGFFSTKIAYCKKILRPGKTSIKHICVADYDGTNEQVLVDTPTINVAPRWNNDAQCPLVFYSEGTNTNMRMMVSDMKKRRKIASNFDGLNMLPSFSQDGKKVVYCASRGDGSCQIYCFSHGTLKKLTHNFGNNVSPSLSSSGEKLYFCSDHETGYPQIYCYDLKTEKQERITKRGYCAAPNYCEEIGKVAYSKKVKGFMQLFAYDEKTGEHTQLTFDNGNKQECSWSPCGNYLLFSYEIGPRSMIAMLNVVTSQKRVLTNKRYVCNYPSWSPAYHAFPTVAV